MGTVIVVLSSRQVSNLKNQIRALPCIKCLMLILHSLTLASILFISLLLLPILIILPYF